MRKIHWYDFITINIFWLGLTTISQTNLLIVPLMVQRFYGPEEQATQFGTLRLYSLMTALLVQALAGLLSDHSTHPWGRRRPFILLGTLLNAACMFAIGASPTYWFLFAAVVLSQFASNIAHGAEQGLIPDLVPDRLKGRFSSIKAILELLPIIIVGRVIGKMVADGHLWLGIGTAVGISLATMLITMFAREEPLPRRGSPIKWEPFARLLLMTLLFAATILGLRALVEWVGTLLLATEHLTTLLSIMGGVGLLAMLTAVVFGVWVSVRVSIGSELARQSPSFSWWVINRLAFLIGANNLSSFAIYFFQTRLGLEGEAAADPASQLMMVVGILILVFALASGWMADRMGRKTLVAGSGVLAFLGAITIVLAPNLGTIYIGGSLVGAATGTFFTANWALGTSLVPKGKAGRYLGISNLAGAGAGAIGACIGGPIADYFTVRTPNIPGMGYLLLFAIYGMLFLVSSLVLTQVREPPRENLNEIDVSATPSS